MDIWYESFYSNALNRDMNVKVYGHTGTPILFIPCQDGSFVDFENFKMLDVFAPFIEAGHCQVFSVDILDPETVTSKDWDKEKRIRRYEDWVSHIIYEFVPWMRHINGTGKKPMTFGCSLGAMHAANLYFRFPDVFGSTLCLSGLYSMEYSFDGYSCDLIYQNSPVSYIGGMPYDHPYIQKYNEGKAIIVVGQGAWEDETKAGTADLDTVCKQKGINAQFHYWGYDVNHDWDWWFKQVQVYLPELLEI